MKRLTTDAPKNNLESALNMFYAKDGETWVLRGGPEPAYADVTLFDYIRSAILNNYSERAPILNLDNDDLGMVISESWLFDGNATIEGIIATLYTAGWVAAELRARLKAYEDTGLDPEEIEKAMSDCADTVADNQFAIKDIQDLGGIEHIRELVQAERECRLLLLPCKVGDTVFVVGKCRVVECCIDEAYLDDAKGLEYLVSFDCDSACEGCPFYDWHQDVTGEYSCNGEFEEASIKGADFGKTVFLTREEAEAALSTQRRKP